MARRRAREHLGELARDRGHRVGTQRDQSVVRRGERREGDVDLRQRHPAARPRLRRRPEEVAMDDLVAHRRGLLLQRRRGLSEERRDRAQDLVDVAEPGKMDVAGELDEARAGDARRQLAAGPLGDGAIAPSMQDQGWRSHQREDRRDVGLVHRLEQPRRHLRRRALTLEARQPLGGAGRRAAVGRDEQLGQEPGAEPPAGAHHREHRLSDLRGPETIAAGEGAVQDQGGHAPRMPHREAHRDRPGTRDGEERHALVGQLRDHRLQIEDIFVEREVDAIAAGKSAPLAIEPDHGVVPCERARRSAESPRSPTTRRDGRSTPAAGSRAAPRRDGNRPGACRARSCKTGPAAPSVRNLRPRDMMGPCIHDRCCDSSPASRSTNRATRRGSRWSAATRFVTAPRAIATSTRCRT